MHKNVLFRGCTRPAMFMGVPYVPFFIGAGACMLLAMYFNLFLLLLIVPVVFVMRQMARRDEMIFRLLGLRWQVKLKTRNRRRHDGMWVYTPNSYREKPASNLRRTVPRDGRGGESALRRPRARPGILASKRDKPVIHPQHAFPPFIIAIPHVHS